jgi:hypothetical protein
MWQVRQLSLPLLPSHFSWQHLAKERRIKEPSLKKKTDRQEETPESIAQTKKKRKHGRPSPPSPLLTTDKERPIK